MDQWQCHTGLREKKSFVGFLILEQYFIRYSLNIMYGKFK